MERIALPVSCSLAVEDAKKAIQIDPKYVKAFNRLGKDVIVGKLKISLSCGSVYGLLLVLCV